MERLRGGSECGMRLKSTGIQLLKEAYYMAALAKGKRLRPTNDRSCGGIVGQPSAAIDALNDFGRVVPLLEAKALEMGREILEKEAGKVIDLSNYHRID